MNSVGIVDPNHKTYTCTSTVLTDRPGPLPQMGFILCLEDVLKKEVWKAEWEE